VLIRATGQQPALVLRQAVHAHQDGGVLPLLAARLRQLLLLVLERRQHKRWVVQLVQARVTLEVQCNVKLDMGICKSKSECYCT